jgi:hypothetical protein
MVFLYQNVVLAACGGTVRTWQGTTTAWGTTTNWTGTDVPDTATEDVIIKSTGFSPAFTTNTTIGCIEVQSGTLTASSANRTLTISGDYFKAPISNSLNFTTGTFVVAMVGSTNQTFEAVDDVRGLTINNATSVTLKNNFRILGTLTLTGSGTTIVEGNIQNTAALTIPVGHKLIIKSGAIFEAAGNVTVNGTLEIEGGAELKMANTRVLNVASGGTIKLTGSAGNPAIVGSANAASWFTFTMAGSINANYAVIRRPALNGMNISGTIYQLDNVDFRGMVSSGYAMTLTAAATVPSTLTAIGFYNDDAVTTPKNINANLYNKTAINLTNTSGDVAGASFELDPNSKINWVSSAATVLTIANDAEANEPTATLNPSTAVTFAEFAFSLNQSATATNITSVILTMTGSATMSDLSYVRAYRDVNANCDYDVGTDTQIGSDLSFSGNPLKSNVTIPSGQLTTNSASQQACLLIVASSSASPVDQNTVSFAIVSASDVVNSQSYAMSSTSGPPVNSGTSFLINNTYSQWSGGTSTNWNVTTNWTPVTIPTTTRDCKIGLATRTTLVNTTPVSCANANLQTNGTLDFNNTTNTFEIYNTLNVGTGFNFLNATNANLTMKGNVNQSLELKTAFPGNLIINNNGATNKTITVSDNSAVNGNLTCTAGILEIPNGVTLTVLGNITIQSGCTIAVNAGGKLTLGNTRVLNVNVGGTLQLVGSVSSKAIVSSNIGTAAYSVVVNGTIKARYYTFDHLGTNGVSIESGSTIDSSYFLQDGTFTYPVSSSSTLLKLKRQIPGNALTNMVFANNGSSASSITNIDSTGATAGNLSISNFSGDDSGESYDVDPSYVVNWAGATNTITITQEATSPTPVLTGTTYNMGRFGFQQVEAGASFQNTNVTSLSLTLTGTGTSSDISAVRLYANYSCTGSSGTLVGTGTFSGNPSKVTFNINSGALVVPASATATTKVCVYIEYDISASATNGNTVGIKISSSSDIVNSENYLASTSTTFPVALGPSSTISAPVSTTWTGTTSTDWFVATNWTAGVPNSTINCTIPNMTNDPTIASGTGSCKTLNITNGILVVSAGAFLDIYGDLNKTAGTLTLTGTFSVKDGGLNINHNLFSNTALTNLTLAKTGTGNVIINVSSLSVTTLNFSSTTTTLEVPNGNKLVLPNNTTIGQGTLLIKAGGALEVANGRIITLAGGKFKIAGSNDTFPQNIATKGIVTVTGAGTNTYSFTATSGTIDLVGFQFDRLGVNGLNIGGTTTIANLSGGQFTNLSTTYASVKAIQINTTGTIPTTATNIAWVWGNWNSFNPANTNTPANTAGYKLISSTGCSNRTIDFTGWTGDWFEARATFDVRTKINGTNCTINLGASSSAVSLLYLTAVPFDRAIDVRWRTNAERNHLGFNVYRADFYSAQYKQINKLLIRNMKASGQNQVSYRFIDHDVENGKRYYYYIEDVEVGGKKTFHGPVLAEASSALGNPPADNPGENSETNDAGTGNTSDSGASNPTSNPSYEDLGNGIFILSKTKHNLRIKINPPEVVFNVAAWNGNYVQATTPGYSTSSKASAPELPEKEILIKVDEEIQTAKVIKIASTVDEFTNKLVSPVPSFALNANSELIPSYLSGPTFYNNDNGYPDKYVVVEANTLAINNTKYIKLKINPLKFFALSKKLQSSREIIVDLSLDDHTWDIDPDPSRIQNSLYTVANTLKINVDKGGVFELTYDDFINANVEAPFDQTNLQDWRLYFRDKTIPLEILSANSVFDSGDKVRFYVPFVKDFESKFNQLVLSPDILRSESFDGKMLQVNVDPTNYPLNTESLLVVNKVFEQNNKFIDGITLGDTKDHFFYADLVNYPGMDTLTIPATLTGIDRLNSNNVAVKVHLRGRPGMTGQLIKHHLKLFIGASEEGEVEFDSNEREVIVFEVPSDRFVETNNQVKLKVLGTHAPANDNEFILIDKVEINYYTTKATEGQTKVVIEDSLRAHTLTSFPSNAINAYDTTDAFRPSKLSGFTLGGVAGNYNLTYLVDQKSDSENKKYYVFVDGDQFLKPTELFLNSEYEQDLRDVHNNGDFIVFGENELIEGASELIERRRSEGLSVITVTPEEVYSEFGYGLKTSKALKEFINYANVYWKNPPKYLLILGDGTYDPLDHNVAGLDEEERTSNELGTISAPLIAGRFLEYSSDHYFVTNNSAAKPLLVVGRIPTNDPEMIRNYVDKVTKYEHGDSTLASSKTISFFADQDTGHYEDFVKHTENMMNNVSSMDIKLFSRAELGTKEITKQKIKDEFNAGSLMISLLGHGAFDRFGDDIFNTTDAKNLSNEKYPIVMNWNCESAYFYDPDKSYKSLAEELVLNEEGGSILYIGSTTQTTPTAQSRLANQFFSQITESLKTNSKNDRIGDFMFKAKILVGENEYDRDVVNSFSIIGDPTIKLPRSLYKDDPAPSSAVTPVQGQKKGWFGCSAFAYDGHSEANFLDGVLEFVLYLAFILFGHRFTRKFIR